MKLLVFGSLNLDKTYTLKNFVRAGETVAAEKMEEFCGGKGFNQAIALGRAGNEVFFAGAVGQDGQILLDTLDSNGIDHSFVKKLQGATGHAIIQLNEKGENCILILAGANGEITESDAKHTLSHFGRGDWILLQNEISCLPQIIRSAKEKGMTIALNPSPYNEKIADCDISAVDYLLINETEGTAMTEETVPDAILDTLHRRYPKLNILLTLGSNGSLYQSNQGTCHHCGIYQIQTVDTTAAGDTFTGYFLSEMLRHGQADKALHIASVAAGIAVSRNGAEPSIPTMEEVQQHL